MFSLNLIAQNTQNKFNHSGLNKYRYKSYINNHIPNIVITSIKIFERELIRPYLINNIGEICLKYNQNFISFEFTTTDCTMSEKNKYAFRMLGIDKKWIFRNANRRFANYTNLSSGHYTFMVKGSNSDGIWSKEGTIIQFYISPPFWKTWWAYSIYTLLFLLFFLIGHKIRVKQLKKKKKELSREIDKRTSELEEANMEIKIINEDLEQSMLNLSKMNTELKEANKLKSEFIGIAAHDLKNPLQVILGYTDILKMKLKKHNEDTKAITKINGSVEKMLILIKELLKTASIDGGQIDFKMEKIDLCELMLHAVEVNKTLAFNKRQTIYYSKCAEAFMLGDTVKIVQVFDNLISNGIKYSPFGQDIFVTIEVYEGMAIVKVKDNGPGFTDEDKKNLFKKFQKLSARPTADEVSTGLGLSICKTFVERHSGEIYVESEVGNGSTFVVKLPLIT
jgi:signal transduction histidine kinase